MDYQVETEELGEAEELEKAEELEEAEVTGWNS